MFRSSTCPDLACGHRPAVSPWKASVWRRAAFVFLIAWMVQPRVSAADSLPELLSLEQIDQEKFEPAVHEQIHLAYEAILRRPREAEGVGKLGMILQAYGKYELAEACYRRANALAPGSFRWVYYLANVEAWRGKHEQAMQHIREGIKIEPESTPARLRLAQLLFDAGEIEQSGKIYQQLTKEEPGAATAHFGLGQVQAAQGDWSRAIQSYSRACEISKNYAAAHYALGMAYRRAGEMSQAREHLGRYQQAKLQKQPSDDPLTDAVNALYAGGFSRFAEGSKLLQQGKLREAAAEFESALKANPRLVMAHTNLIAIYAQLGAPEKAERHFTAAVEMGPGWVEAYHNWGMFQLRRGKTTEAIEAFSKAIRINPNYADSHVELGSLLDQMGRREEAAQHYQKALESEPAHRQAHYLLGRSLVRIGLFQDGISHLRETIKVEDDKTPICMQTLSIAYEYAGNHEDAVHYLQEARKRAISLGKESLAADLQRELDRLTSQPAPR